MISFILFVDLWWSEMNCRDNRRFLALRSVYRRTEICQLDFVIDYQHILRFDVAMDNLVLMKVSNCLADLLKVAQNQQAVLVLIFCVCLSNYLDKVLLTLLKNHVNPTIFQDNVPKWDNKRTMKLILNLNLVADNLDRFFLDIHYLYGKLLLRKIVDCLPYLPKAAFCYLLKERKLAARAEAFFYKPIEALRQDVH